MPSALKKELIDELMLAYKEIDNCPELNEFRDKLNQRRSSTQYKLLFNHAFTYAGAYSYDISSNHSFITIRINPQFVDNYLGYDGNTKGELKIGNVPLYSTLGHELLHFWLDWVTGSDEEECKIWSLEKKCLDPNTDVGSFKCKCDIFKKYWPEECECNKNSTNSNSKSVSDICEEEKPDDEDSGHHDWADDNYSSAYGNNESSDLSRVDLLGFSGYISGTYGEFIQSYYPDILIYKKNNLAEMEKLLNRSETDNFIDDYEHIDFSNEHKVLVVPSGELMGERDSELIKLALGRFVENGGTLLVFGQQYGEDVDKLVPIPDGECLQSYGWRQDQSCYNGSLYFEDMHPALSGLTYVRPTAGVDGYFPVYPSSSTILLRRISNEEPALLYYPYGNGTVILTSLYTDFGLAHSQASSEELRMVRDLITFAKNPKLDISMFNLATNSRPAIGLSATIRNTTETPAAKIKLRVSTADRTRVLYEIEEALALDGGAETTLPINFDLPVLTSKEYGICHTDYELYDAEGNLLQMASEADSGRLFV